MTNLDISALAERIRQHRFHGYTNNMLADEIDRFRSGPGVSGISEAVEALNAVAQAMAETDRTLRTELGKLGVEWRSDAATQARAMFTEHATFSQEANAKLETCAQSVFAQGEAFTRTLHKLPESQTLREGAGSYGITDAMFSLLGFETDNAKKAASAREARTQTVEALNTYAVESGENLGGVEVLDSPAPLSASTPSPIPASAGTGPVVTPTTSTGTTTAATAGSACPPVPAPTAAAASAPAPAPAPTYQQPTYSPAPAAPLPAASTGSATPSDTTVPQSTTPSSVSASSSSGTSSGVSGYAGTQLPRSPGTSGTTSRPGTAGVGNAPGGVPGTAGVPGTPGGRAPTQGPGQVPGQGVVGKIGAVPGSPGGTGATPGTPGTPDQQPLAKGRVMGTGPVAGPVSSAGTTGVPPAATAGRSFDGLGSGAAAMAAGGVAGALSGDQDRKGRGVGRSAPGAATSPRQMQLGNLPDEEERIQRNSDRLNGQQGRQRDPLLEKAAPQEGEEDAGHVRRFGVDDNDLFADERMVAPDVIGQEEQQAQPVQPEPQASEGAGEEGHRP